MSTTRTTVAFHEAGHVIAECRWGRGAPAFASVTRIGKSRGRVQPMPGRVSARAPLAIRRNEALSLARFLLAGLAAEEVLAGEPRWGVVDDDEPDDEPESENVWLAGMALAFPEIAEACTLVRAAYPGRGDDTPIVRREYRATCKYLRAHWPHVAAVASALLQRENLNADEIVSVLTALPALDMSRLSEPAGTRWCGERTARALARGA